MDLLPDNCCLADDHAGAVVDEKTLADGSPGVDIDAGEAVGQLEITRATSGAPIDREYVKPVMNDSSNPG
jgi:hypothetical protein